MEVRAWQAVALAARRTANVRQQRFRVRLARGSRTAWPHSATLMRSTRTNAVAGCPHTANETIRPPRGSSAIGRYQGIRALLRRSPPMLLGPGKRLRRGGAFVAHQVLVSEDGPATSAKQLPVVHIDPLQLIAFSANAGSEPRLHTTLYPSGRGRLADRVLV
jgi:hypothetical protein